MIQIRYLNKLVKPRWCSCVFICGAGAKERWNNFERHQELDTKVGIKDL